MMAIAIDGPAGAGKSTLARALSERLGYIYVDTGALYRAIGFCAARAGVAMDEEQVMAGFVPGLRLDLRFVNGEQRVLVNDEDVSERIRTPEMSMAASRVSALPSVRAHLLEMQRDMARRSHVVMDGRDIGTVVLPDARVKIFLTASPEERARRRLLDLQAKGETQTFEEVLHDVLQRDRNDSGRAIAPLRQAPDAVLLDTTALNFEQTLEQMLQIVHNAS